MMCIICNIVIYVIKDTIYFSNYVNVIGMLQCMRVCATCIKVLVITPSLFVILLPFFKDRSDIRTTVTCMSTQYSFPRLYNTSYFLVIYLLISQHCCDRTNNMILCKTISSQMLRQTLITDGIKNKNINYIHGIPMHIGTVRHKIHGHTLHDKLMSMKPHKAMQPIIYTANIEVRKPAKTFLETC